MFLISGICPVVFTASFASYLVFHKYEPKNPSALAALICVIPAVLSSLSLTCFDNPLAVPLTFLCYWALILAFTVGYRLSPIHPLANYPGPVLNKASKLKTFQTAYQGRLHVAYQTLHEKYGDIVRVGPNELSYCNMDGVLSILGANGLPKGPYHDNRQVPGLLPSLPFLRDVADHTRRRRLWNRAFNGTSLKDYDEIIVRRSREVVNALGKRTSQKIDISQWMGFFAYDFVDLTRLRGYSSFSFSFDMMKEGKDIHGYLVAVHSLVQSAGSMCHLPWAMALCRKFTTPKAAINMDKLAKKMVEQRLKAGSMTRDLVYHLSDEGSKESEKPSAQQVFSEADTAIIAGSDTVSTVLSNIWYYLLRNPTLYTRLREEIDASFPGGEEPINQQKLSEMPYLNACISESMRLQPPVPSGSQRWVPPGTGGKMVGSHFVPEGSTIYVATYSLHRDPRYFSPYPNTFWPDRWLEPGSRRSLQDVTKPLENNVNVVLCQRAFIPFSAGPRACVGKPLALAEIRVTLSSIVQRFDMRVADRHDIDDWEASLQDYFVLLKKSTLPVVLTDRI